MEGFFEVFRRFLSAEVCLYNAWKGKRGKRNEEREKRGACAGVDSARACFEVVGVCLLIHLGVFSGAFVWTGHVSRWWEPVSSFVSRGFSRGVCRHKHPPHRHRHRHAFAQLTSSPSRDEKSRANSPLPQTHTLDPVGQTVIIRLTVKFTNPLTVTWGADGRARPCGCTRDT